MTRYRDGDLLTVRQIAEQFGKSTQYVQALAGRSNTHQDPNLFRLRVRRTSRTVKCSKRGRSYVYPWNGVRDWYRERQTRGWVIGAAKRGQ